MKKRIEIKQVRMQKLDPSKPYIVRLDESFTTAESELVREKLREWGLEKVIVIIGDVKITEIKNASNSNK